MPIQHEDLLQRSNAIPLFDLNGEDTLWGTVFYDKLKEDINSALIILGDMRSYNFVVDITPNIESEQLILTNNLTEGGKV